MKKRKKSLEGHKGKFGRIKGKDVEVLDTHERYGETLQEGERGIVRSGGGFGLYDTKSEVPVYFPDKKEIIGVAYEHLCFVTKREDEVKHPGHKKGRRSLK